jgi:formate hydrogenlyase subunit 6/NADH:ubiquinone oxidoreductase subunit I
MLKLLREVLRVGEVTLPYPAEPVSVMPGFRGRPEHAPERCIACAACAIACPSNAMTISTDLDRGCRTWSFFTGRCIYCGRCEEVCPTHAITLSPYFELAVLDKNDLYERAEYALAACRQCGVYFAPRKEVDYAAGLLARAGLSDGGQAARALLEICPACKRQNDGRNLVGLYQEAGDGRR